MNENQIQGITAASLAQKVLSPTPVFILDVRNENDFNDWKIEGKNVTIRNAPYFELLDGVDEIADQIPDDQEVVVVCAKEGSSKFVAEQLIEGGKRNIAYLIGGMKSWSEHLEPVKIADLQEGGALYQFKRLGKGCLSYMIISSGEAAVIDAVRTTAVFEDFAKENHAVIKHTVDTHLHADHISGGRQLAEAAGGSYWLPQKDAAEVIFPYEKLEEGSSLVVGRTKVEIQPIYSPGHTIGSTSLLIDNKYLLSGDILFVKSIGRPDLAGKVEDWVTDLRTTLYERYKQLSDDLIVLPAHFGKIEELGDRGQVTARLGDLYKQNPGLNIYSEDEFRRTVTENLPPQPNAYQEIRQTNMGRIDPTLEEQREMEIGPNRCAVHDDKTKETRFPHTATNDEIHARAEAGEKLNILDVREPAEYAFGHIPGAISLPLGELEEKMPQLDPHKEYYVICRSGNRSDMACQMLAARGFTRIKNVMPGMSQWEHDIEQD